MVAKPTRGCSTWRDFPLILTTIAQEELSIQEAVVLLRLRGPGGIALQTVETVWTG
jgi:hypothetical protein